MKRNGKQDIILDITDILPTIADVAGVSIPENYKINGRSLLPYFMGEKEKHRDWIYSFLYHTQMIRGSKFLRDGYGVTERFKTVHL
jgi:arylsulfatase A-like enzyme